MAGNTVTLEFAGDADKLKKAAKESDKALSDVGKAADDSSQAMEKNGKSSGQLLDKFSKLGNAVGGAGDAIDQVSGLLADFSQIQSRSYEKSQQQQRALNDVRQAQEDYNQAIRDSKQATIDAGQAQIDKKQADLDAANALKQYNSDAKEYGANSAQAKQDSIDLLQAKQDLKQATEDGNQAQRDANQATIDAKGAQLDLNDAQREAKPPDSQKWIQDLETFTPLLQGLVGITGLVTAAQWAFNASLFASPITWIIAGIAVLVVGIVLLVKHWGTVKAAGEAAWRRIKVGAEVAWTYIKKIPGWLGDAFKLVGNAIFGPFRWAFNKVSDAWNATVGGLHWTVPGWVPGIGGNSIGVPHLPHFHSGGTVPGPPGSEMLAVLTGGEKISRNGGPDDEMANVTVMLDGDVLVEALSKVVRRRGGNVQLALGGRNA